MKFLPSGSHLLHAAVLGAAVMAWFMLIYGGADWVTAQRSLRIPVHFDIEQHIPFVPAAVVVYMSIYPLFAAAPFLLPSRRQLRRLARVLATTIAVAGLVFLALPSELAYSTAHDYGPWTDLFRVADAINLRYNLLPSLHVGLSVACVDAYTREVSRPVRIGLWGWAAAVAASTLLTHQHHVLDVVTGWALGLVASRWWHPRVQLSDADRPITR